MDERKQCKNCQKNKARLNSELCLDCSLKEVAAGKMKDRPTEPPSKEAIRNMILKERGGVGVVPQEKKYMDKKEGDTPPPRPSVARPEEVIFCGRCLRQIPAGTNWNKKRGWCQTCANTANKYAREGKPCPPYRGMVVNRSPQAEPQPPAAVPFANQTPPRLKEPEPLPPPESSAGDSVVDGLIKAFHMHIDKPRQIQDALMAINRLAGADIEIPEIKP